jgi:hypothetical protein
MMVLSLSLHPIVTSDKYEELMNSIEYNLCLIILACDSGNYMSQNAILCVCVCVCARARACVCVCARGGEESCPTESEFLFYVQC